MADDIELDEETETSAPATPKDPTPAWAVLVMLITFVCLVATLALQVMETRYLRGSTPSDADPYAEETLFPST